MDKKLHKTLNIVETICVLVGISCISFAAMLHFGEGIQGLNVYQTLLFVFGILSEIAVVSIELFFFHLETLPYKFITSAFYITELVVIMIMNMIIPFSGLLVLTTFSIIKNVYRVSHVSTMYPLLAYYELCKKFGIKVKRPRKARATAIKKNAVPVKRTKRSTTKTREPNYA